MEQKKKRRNCLLISLAVVVGCLCVTVILGGVGYYLYSTGELSLDDIPGLGAFGPGEIQVINLSDGEIEAALTRISTDGETINEGNGDLAPYDIKTFRSLNSNRYTLAIDVLNGVPASNSCTIEVGGGETYRVVVVPEGMVITLDGEQPDRVEEINILTSPHCQP